MEFFTSNWWQILIIVFVAGGLYIQVRHNSKRLSLLEEELKSSLKSIDTRIENISIQSAKVEAHLERIIVLEQKVSDMLTRVASLEGYMQGKKNAIEESDN